jgi:hypothetical protein
MEPCFLRTSHVRMQTRLFTEEWDQPDLGENDNPGVATLYQDWASALRRLLSSDAKADWARARYHLGRLVNYYVWFKRQNRDADDNAAAFD